MLIWFVCVSVSEQCVKTGYLPRSVGERTGQTPGSLDKSTMIPHSQYFPLLSCFPLFHLLCFFYIIFNLSLFHSFNSIFTSFFPSPLPLISFVLFFFVSLSFNIMPICEKRLKHVLFRCHPSSALFCQLQRSRGYLGLVIISCGE